MTAPLDGSSSPAALATLRANGADLLTNTAALAFSQVSVPAAFIGVLGEGPVNGYVLMLRLQRYIVSRALLDRLGTVNADATLAGYLGEQEFSIDTLPRLLRCALGLPTLSADEQAALRTGNSAIASRLDEAVRLAAHEFRRDTNRRPG